MKSSGRLPFFFARSERDETNVDGVHPVEDVLDTVRGKYSQDGPSFDPTVLK